MPVLAVLVVLAPAALLAAGLLVAGQVGALQGQPPNDLGLHQGHLKAPSATPNSVSSEAALHAGHPMQQLAMIAPLQLPGSPPAEAIGRIAAAVQAMPGAVIVRRTDDYLYARFTSRWLGFVDDAEFWADGSGAVQLRSASRIGRGDFGVNRARIEQLRARLASPSS